MNRWLWIVGICLGGVVLAAGVRPRASLATSAIGRCVASTERTDEPEFNGANAVRRRGEEPRRHHRVRHGRSARR